MKPSTKTMLGLGSLVGVVAGVMLSVGGVSTAVVEQVWQKYGNTVRLTASTTDVYIPQSDITAKSVTTGTNGTAIDGWKVGECFAWSPANTITASSSQNISCTGASGALTAIAGIGANDDCQLWATTTISSTFGGVLILSSNASSTAGTVNATLFNNTGTTFTWGAVASTSFKYRCSSR